MAEMLSMAEERGDSVSVSFYEVSQETVYDVLDKEKRVVSVLEGPPGKIQLKGLSKASHLVLWSIKSWYNIIDESKFLLSGTCEVTLGISRGVFRAQQNPEAGQRPSS